MLSLNRSLRRGGSKVPAPAASSGFTLIELVISVAILGLVMTAMLALIGTSLTVGKDTERRLDSSNALRRVQRAFADDVASSTEVVKNTTSAQCGGGTALIEMRGKTFNEPPEITPPLAPAQFSTAVAYVYSGGTLTRLACRAPTPPNGSTPPLTLNETVEVASGLSAATVSCSPSCTDPDAMYSLVLTPSGETAQTLSASRRTS